MSSSLKNIDTIYDRAVHVIRNPIDSVVSRLNLMAVDRGRQLNATSPELSGNKHEAKPIRDPIGVDFRALQQASTVLTRAADLAEHVDDWVEHARFWSEAWLPRHRVRYEDLRQRPIAELTRIVRFLLPDVDLDSDPIVNRHSIACATLPNPALEPYRPRRIANFASWDDYTPEARRLLLDKTWLWWCRFGYEQLAQAQGLTTGLVCPGPRRSD